MTRNPPKGSLRRYPRRRRSGPSAIIIILLLCRLFGRRISTREASLICIKANAICHFGINKNGVHKQTTTMTSHANLYAHARARCDILSFSLSQVSCCAVDAGGPLAPNRPSRPRATRAGTTQVEEWFRMADHFVLWFKPPLALLRRGLLHG